MLPYSSESYYFLFLKVFDTGFFRDQSMMWTCYTYWISVEFCIWLFFQYTETGSRLDRSYKFMQASVPHWSFVYRDIKFFTEDESPLFRKRCFTVKLLSIATLNLELLSCGKQILSLNRDHFQPRWAGIRILTVIACRPDKMKLAGLTGWSFQMLNLPSNHHHKEVIFTCNF
jgi:hypothetical protein